MSTQWLRVCRTTGERYDDVIVFWVPSEADKHAPLEYESTLFLSKPHFEGHSSVLLRGSRVGELSHQELTELIQDAWLTQTSARRAQQWLQVRPS